MTVAVIGGGTMGAGIAQVALTAGYDVVLVEATDELARAAQARLHGSLRRAAERGKLPDGIDAVLARLRTAAGMDVLGGAQTVIEAVPERPDLKGAVLRDAERFAPETALLGSNTSSISITQLADGLRHPERFLGLHFFNPVYAMPLVEIIVGERTAPETVAIGRRFAERLGKQVVQARDAPGFLTSRLGVVLGLEAVRALEQGVATAEDIDRAMQLGYGHPMGPLRLTDLVGLDVRADIADALLAAYGGDQYRVPELMRRMVAEGRLGRKTGEGFYTWQD